MCDVSTENAMRASGLKRELSSNSINGPPEKKYARKVSFGSLETVVFNKNHSSSKLTGGVSVSSPGFGSTPNARWGNGDSPSSNANFTWGSSSSSSNSNSAGNSRWGQSPAVNPQANMFLSSQMTNAVNVLMQQAASTDPTRQVTQGLQRQSSSSNMFQAQRPNRAPSPTNMHSFATPQSPQPLQRHHSTGSMFHFGGPRQPIRAPSPTNANFNFAAPQLQRHKSVDSVFVQPPTQPARVPSPINLFPPVNNNMFLQSPTPQRPGR